MNTENVCLSKRKSMPVRFADDRFELIRQEASGSFSYVFRALDNKTLTEVAVKIENSSSVKHSMLAREYTFYDLLSETEGIPKVIWFGEFRKRTALVLPYLGEELSAKLSLCKGTFTASTATLIALDTLRILKSLHLKGVVHRDLKPENILTSRTGDRIYLIDFRLVTFYIDPETGRRKVPVSSKSLAGTPRFASIAGHNGTSQAPKDDIESLLYLVLYLIKGRLPWQSLKGSRREVYKEICTIKRTMAIEKICEGAPTH